MANLKMYSIRDSKGEFYSQPFVKNTHGEAERDFQSLANDEKSQVAQYPEDFDLYFLGEYDNITGKITPQDSPQHVQKAVNALRKAFAAQQQNEQRNI